MFLFGSDFETATYKLHFPLSNEREPHFPLVERSVPHIMSASVGAAYKEVVEYAIPCSASCFWRKTSII